MSKLDRLRNQLECSICFENFKDRDPRGLPCLHSFCKVCLDSIPKNGDTIKCPICRYDYQLPPGGVADIPVAFPVHMLIELCESMEQQGAAAEDGNIPMCTRHGKVRVYYCRPCDVAICGDCLIDGHQGPGHSCQKAEDLHDMKKQELQKSLDIVCQWIDDFNATPSQFDAEVNRVKEQAAGIKNEIDQFILELHRRLDIAKDSLLNDVDRLQRQKLQNIEHKREAVETVLFQLTSCKDYVKDKLDNGTPLQVMAVRREMMSYMKATTLHADMHNVLPKKNFLYFDAKKDIGNDIGNLFYVDLEDCKISYKNPVNLHGQSSLLSLLLPSSAKVPNHSFVYCHAVSDPRTFVKTKLRKISDHEYQVKMYPTALGPHQVDVRFGDCHIQGSPFMLHVLPRNDMRQNPIRTLRRGFDCTILTLAIRDDGCIVIGRQSEVDCISILDKDGNRQHSFGTRGIHDDQIGPEFKLVLLNDNSCVILDKMNKSLKKFTAEGEFLISVQRGDNFVLNNPKFLVVSKPDQKIYVVDFNPFIIHSFNADLTYVASFCRNSRQRMSVCIGDFMSDLTGNLFISDYKRHCIYKVITFEDDNKLQLEEIIGRVGCPTFMAFDKMNTLFIMRQENHRSGHNHFLSVYKTSESVTGNIPLVGNISFSSNCPTDKPCKCVMAFDNDGYLYIVDPFNHCVTIH